jgi:hypothetical protein
MYPFFFTVHWAHSLTLPTILAGTKPMPS